LEPGAVCGVSTWIARLRGHQVAYCASTGTFVHRLVSFLYRRRRRIVFYIVIFGGLAIVLVVAFFMKWSQRNNWPDDE
jgi:phosphotransferase system  glucose/maltose/N-acetylglucosamine-specific IIC component